MSRSMLSYIIFIQTFIVFNYLIPPIMNNKSARLGLLNESNKSN